MSLLNWFSSKKKPSRQPAAEQSSGLSRLDSTKPFDGATPLATAQPGNRKQERMARRELLYAVVRECMVRAGVLSSSYKFKVLSLDPRGRQFLVMVDLAQGAGAETTQLAEIEAMVAQTAKQRHDIMVTAVYWRSIEHVAVGEPVARAPAARPPISRPAPLQAQPAVSAPVPLEETSRPVELMPEPPRGERFEPLHPAEVEAFKRALASGMKASQAVATTTRNDRAPGAQQSYTLLTGFEDTEMAENVDHLSGTQYGELR